MTDAAAIALIAIVPPSLLAFTGLIVALSNARHLQEVDDRLADHHATQ